MSQVVRRPYSALRHRDRGLLEQSTTAIGLDIGATKWMAVTDNGASDVREGVVHDDPERTVDDLAQQVAPADVIRQVGCAFAGVLDADGAVSTWPNRPSWEGFPVLKALRSRLGGPVTVVDDGVCAAIGEWSSGAARGIDDFICVTFGTGIGSALFLDGELRPYAPGRPNGVGHFRGGLEWTCRCGMVGCFQPALSDRRAVSELAVTRFAQLITDLAAMLNLTAIVLTGGRLIHTRELGTVLADQIRRELRGLHCAVVLSNRPNHSAVIGAYQIAAGIHGCEQV